MSNPSLSLLLIGGTGFIGPHTVAAALARGHRVTLFNRGRFPEKVPAGVEVIQGDRNISLAPLAGRTFDAVIDNCGYLPKQVQRSIDALRGSVGRYIFISSISAYKASRQPLTEDSPLATLPEDANDGVHLEKVTGENYGALKVLCEQEVLNGLAFEPWKGQATIVRPGLIVGPGDHTDRFTHWPARFYDAAHDPRSRQVLCPGSPSDPIHVIDVRDLADWLITLVERNQGGIFNAVGPLQPLTIGGLVQTCQDVCGGGEPVWLDAATLDKHEVSAWGDMPTWIPVDSEEAGMNQVSFERSLQAGLTLRPIRETVQDTLTWWLSLPEARRAEPKAGISRDRELAVLAAERK